MFTQTQKDSPFTGNKTAFPTLSLTPSKSWTIFALLIGVFLAIAVNLLFPPLLTLAKVAMFPLCAALSTSFCGYLLRRRHDPAGWGLIIGGQLVGIVGAVLLFLTSII